MRALAIASAVVLTLACESSPTARPNEDPSLDPQATPRHALKIAVSGQGAVRSTPQAIDCRAHCSQSLIRGTRVVLAAVAAEGHTFVGWSGACAGAGACDLTMEADQSVFATFQPVPPPPPPPPPPPGMKRLTVATTGVGRVTSSPTGIDCGHAQSTAVRRAADFAKGSVVTLLAAPGAGHELAHWGGLCRAAIGPSGGTVGVVSSRTSTGTYALTLRRWNKLGVREGGKPRSATA